MEIIRANMIGAASSPSAEKKPDCDFAAGVLLGFASRNAEQKKMPSAQRAAAPQAPVMLAEAANASPIAAGMITQEADMNARTVALIAAASRPGSSAVSARTLTKISELTDWKMG
ncbi:hypothetical protein [Rhizobium leguminosarum]|uniref:Uncharacterized protein n=1 Tax=Rhizobium leguminosarum TaxID=384 RepID=A0A7W9ZPP3_RHILE|nr:hypothetical protein [Rhizobium leguminosarum]MBB6219382.1 hypothetical protein [Rhizobium leguminosarum]